MSKCRSTWNCVFVRLPYTCAFHCVNFILNHQLESLYFHDLSHKMFSIIPEITECDVSKQLNRQCQRQILHLHNVYNPFSPGNLFVTNEVMLARPYKCYHIYLAKNRINMGGWITSAHAQNGDIICTRQSRTVATTMISWSTI